MRMKRLSTAVETYTDGGWLELNLSSDSFPDVSTEESFSQSDAESMVSEEAESTTSFRTPPVPRPRTPGRVRMLPERISSGDFVTYQCQPATSQKKPRDNWEKKANFIVSLASLYSFMQMPESSVLQAVVRIRSEA